MSLLLKWGRESERRNKGEIIVQEVCQMIRKCVRAGKDMLHLYCRGSLLVVVVVLGRQARRGGGNDKTIFPFNSKSPFPSSLFSLCHFFSICLYFGFYPQLFVFGLFYGLCHVNFVTTHSMAKFGIVIEPPDEWVECTASVNWWNNSMNECIFLHLNTVEHCCSCFQNFRVYLSLSLSLSGALLTISCDVFVPDLVWEQTRWKRIQ